MKIKNMYKTSQMKVIELETTKTLINERFNMCHWFCQVSQSPDKKNMGWRKGGQWRKEVHLLYLFKVAHSRPNNILKLNCNRYCFGQK